MASLSLQNGRDIYRQVLVNCRPDSPAFLDSTAFAFASIYSSSWPVTKSENPEDFMAAMYSLSSVLYSSSKHPLFSNISKHPNLPDFITAYSRFVFSLPESKKAVAFNAFSVFLKSCANSDWGSVTNSISFLISSLSSSNVSFDLLSLYDAIYLISKSHSNDFDLDCKQVFEYIYSDTVVDTL